MRFKQIGQTFGRWVRDNRLEACRTALRDENQRALNISQIAYRWGFNDLSHFNKTFRARFDQSPREWRNGSDVPENQIRTDLDTGLETGHHPARC